MISSAWFRATWWWPAARRGGSLVLAALLLATLPAPVSAQEVAPAAVADPAPAATPSLVVQAEPDPADLDEAAPLLPGDTPTVDPQTLPRDFTPLGMFLHADIVVKSVMIGLILASVLTWTILLAKGIQVSNARRTARAVHGELRAADSLGDIGRRIQGQGPAGELVTEASLELYVSSGMPPEGIKERVASRLERVEAAAGRSIAAGIGVLATIGSTAPFVGLFGTVWGIMNSFIGISQAQTTNLAIVAPGIAEALLATGIGLVAAIPAVVIYNVFTRWISAYRAELADSAAQVMRLVSRDLDRRPRLYAEAAQ